MEIKIFRDSLSSYSYHSWEEKKDGKVIKHITEEIPCSCHPETCCHFDGKKIIRYTEEKDLVE
jgi:hypothetical protein